MVILTSFLYHFTLLLGLLLGLKLLLTLERMARGKWPVSLKYLWQIIEWKKELTKFFALALIAFLISCLGL